MTASPSSLDALFRGAPDVEDAVVEGSSRLSSGTVADRADRLAGALAAQGLGGGDVVAWQLPNWPESIVLYRACWRLGAVAAPLHHRAGRQEVAQLRAALEPGVVVAAPDTAAAAVPGAIRARGDGAFERLLDHEPLAEPGAVDAADRALVMFTSGSSAAAKGVVHTHGSLGHKAVEMVEVHGLTPDDVVLMPAPMAHVSGLLNGLLVPTVAGMKVVLMEHWDPDDALDLIEREQVSFMVGPPTFFHGLMDAPGFDARRVRSLRVVSCGGTGVTPDFVRTASDRLGATVKRSYGSTEAPTITTSHAGDPVEAGASTDGRPSGSAELRITDPSTGLVLAPGSAGELWVRGPELFAGYLDDDQTAEVLIDGWFRTGDLAVVDAAGSLTIVGRVKDVIIRRGENISPAEVEEVLESHPSIRRAVVVGVVDDAVGERVAAAIVSDDALDAEACRQWFRDHGVATFKAPELVVTVDELPLLASGKPDRRSIQRRIADEVLHAR